jgi:hypothetical protein
MIKSVLFLHLAAVGTIAKKSDSTTKTVKVPSPMWQEVSRWLAGRKTSSNGTLATHDFVVTSG